MSGSDVDARCDLYALGCVAYWMLTGRLVFDGDSVMQLLMQHVRTPARPPSEVADQEIPPALDRLVLECLAKEPEQRPESADVLWERLGEIALQMPWSNGRARSWWETHVPWLCTAEAGRPEPRTAKGIELSKTRTWSGGEPPREA